MNKFFILLALGLSVLPSLHSADITVSNYSSTGRGIFGVADSAGALLGGAGAKGVVIGRMTADEIAVAAMAEENDIAGLHEAFVPFAAATDPFAGNSASEYGLMVLEASASTAPADSDFGGEAVYVWIYKGSSNPLLATHILLARLNATFPTDSDTPSEAAFLDLRPDTATFLLGSSSGASHDYQFEDGDGPLATLQMEEQIPVIINNPPVATPGNLTVIRGQSANEEVTGTDGDDDDTLTFFVVDAPTKGSVEIEENGSYQYTSTPGLTGNDSFTFRAYDGKDYSPPATVTVTIQDNTAPIVIGSNISVIRGASSGGDLSGVDVDSDPLTFFLVDAPAIGSVTIEENGSYQYTSTPGLTGNDSFTFRAYDGIAYSELATITVTITDLPPGSAAPVIAITELPSGYVGTYYEYEVPIANPPQGNATSYTAKALPGGLKMDKNTGIISGYPTKAFTDKTVTLLFKNDAGDSGQIPVTITIKDVPSEVVGTFLATVSREDGIADGFGGRLNLTVTSKGAFTAKLQSGPTAYTAKGKLTIAEDEEDVIVEVVGLEFSRRNFPTLTANLFFDLSDLAESDFQLTGTLANVEEGSADITGVRNTWSRTLKPESYTGDYTYSLRIPLLLENNPLYPQGDGFGALTVKDNGTATFVGKTADGKTFTVPTILGPQGHLPLFSAFAVKTSSLVATPRIVIPDVPSEDILNSITGSVSWMKPEAEAKSKDRAYRAGFDAFDLTLLGGMYKVPAPGGVVAGLDDNGPEDAQANAWLTFSAGGLEEGDISTFPFTIMNKNKKDTGIKQTVIVPKATPKTPETNPNPNLVTFKLLSRPAGYFTGFFTLPNEVRALTRKTPFQGTFVRLSDGSYDRAGFFLLAELPEGSEKITQTPQHSGLIELQANDPDLVP